MCAALSASAAHGLDVTVRSSLTQRGEVSDNAFLGLRPSGPTYTALSTLVLDAVAGTPTTRYALISDLTYRKYLGPGARDTALSEPKEYGSRFDVEHKGKAATTNVGISWRRRDVASALLEDVGVGTVRGDITTIAAQGGVRYSLTPRDTLVWSLSGSSVEFSSPTATPYRGVRSGASWIHKMNPATDFVFLVDVDRQIFDNPAKTETTLWRTMAGVQAQVTPVVSLRGNAGIGIVDVENGTAGTATFASLQGGSGSSLAFLWDGSVSYRLTPTLTVSLLAAHSITPTILGDLTKRTSFGGSLRYLINRSSDIALTGDFATISSAGSESDVLTGSAVYNYRWAREWRGQFGYIFRQRDDRTGTVNSSTVFVSATRDATLVP